MNSENVSRKNKFSVDNDNKMNSKSKELLKEYKIEGIIAQGTFGKVKLGLHKKTKEKVAIKIIEKSKIKDKNDKRRINLEIKILKNTFHYNIIKLYEVIETEEEIFIIMEYAEGGDLKNYLYQKKHLTEDLSRQIFQQLIDCIYYLHQIGICHRNIKLENILFSTKKRDKIKIINFGHSNVYLTGVNSDNPTLSFGAEFLETPIDNKEYTPPEMILGCKYDGLLLDIWSCGIILYAMLFGCFPFMDKNIDQLYTKIIKGDFTYPKSITVSEEAELFINKILVVNPRLRSDIIDIKRDIWFMKDYEPISGLFISIRDIPISDQIIEEMEKLGYKKYEIINDIKNNRHNHTTAFYYILVNKYRKEGIETISNLISKEFKEFLREQDLKFNLIKKREKPISIKIMKSNSKSIFNLNESDNDNMNHKIDLDKLKSLFEEYICDDNLIINPNKKLKKNIHPILDQKDIKQNKNTKNMKPTKKKRAKSQKNKNINQKHININQDRYSYSTSLSKRKQKANKNVNKKELLYKNINIISENKGSKNKMKQIMNIKEIIKTKNKTILNNDLKQNIMNISKKNQIQNHLVYNSNSFSKNKKYTSIINQNNLNINNDSKNKLNKIKELKKNNIKNLSLKNKYYKEYLYKGEIYSRNYYNTGLNYENKTERIYKRKYINNSTSNSKSKSIKSKSNYSTGKSEKIFYLNNSRPKTNNFNVKLKVIKPSLIKDKNNISKEKKLKGKNKSKEKKSNSISKCKDSHKLIKHSAIQNRDKIREKVNKKGRDNTSKTKSFNSKKKGNESTVKKGKKSKEKTIPNLNILNTTENISMRNNVFKEKLEKRKNDSLKHKNHAKLFSNTIHKIIPNNKEISLERQRFTSKKSLNLSNNNIIPYNKKKNDSIIKKKKNKVIKNIFTNSNLEIQRQNINRITNIRRASPRSSKEKILENSNKTKIKEIKSIKICNIPKKEIECKNLKNSEYRKINQYSKNIFKNQEKNNNKNRMVINFKKFNNI